MGRFQHLYAAMEHLRQPVDLFVRDDDADIDEPTLHRLLDVCTSRGVPLSLAVIPGTLTTAGADVLNHHLRVHPASVELHQHGCMHRNHEPTGRPCEFGPSRSLTDQIEDIARGKARMDDAFGASWFGAFTPPWNRCTTSTFAALDVLGFEVLSKDRDVPITGYGFDEVSTTLDLYRWRGGAALKADDEIEQALVKQLRAGQPIGVLLHHKVMDDEAFGLFADLLDVLRPGRLVRWHPLSWFASAAERQSVATIR